MQIRQKFELRRLLAPQLRQSLKILTLPLMDLKALVVEELSSNPFLEESTRPSQDFATDFSQPAGSTPKYLSSSTFQDKLGSYKQPSSTNTATARDGQDLDFRLQQVAKKASLQDVLLRQLGMFSNTDEEFCIGQEIIGNIDENGYLKADLAEIAALRNAPIEKVKEVLKLIQQFEPPGVAAKTTSECLLIQLDLANEKDPLMRKIVEFHLGDVAKKNYSHIAKALKEPLEKIEPLIKKILRLDPKPGRNYSVDTIQYINPDIIINEKDDEDFEIIINNEDIPSLSINQDYQDMLKKGNLDPKTKEFLTDKLNNALELLKAISKRQVTLRKVVKTVLEFQQEAIKEGLAHLKPLTFRDVAEKINMHETTICRVVMNKYVKTPYGIIALKDFFSSHVHDKNGQAVSASHVKKLINELVEQEDKKHPLSDQDISNLLSTNYNLNISRRTVAKYREELRILSTVFRRIH